MPPWTHVHPLIVHFPISLLMVSPGLVLLGLIYPSLRRGIHLSALLLLWIGTFTALIALASGEAASGLAQRTSELRSAVALHEMYAQRATILFALLTVAFTAVWIWPGVESRKAQRVYLIIWLILSLWAVFTLIEAGHWGGRMVHELGIHAMPSL